MAGQRFDLVLVDIEVPDRNGWDLMREARERFNVRGIAITAYGRDQDRQASFDAGFAAHLTKPVDVELIIETIKSMYFGPLEAQVDAASTRPPA